MKALFVTPIPEEKKEQFKIDNITIEYKDRKAVTSDDLKDVEIVFGNLPVSLLMDAPSLKLVQLDSAGANQYCVLPEHITLCNAAGAYGTAISEHMLAQTFAIMKNVYAYDNLQKEHIWTNLGSVPTIQNMNVLCVGMGDIGSNYAKRMHVLGAHVSGVRRTIHDKPDYVDYLYTLDDLPSIIDQFDIVALSLPETPQTIGLFDYSLLKKMKEKAILINVGRGSAIVQKDLIRIMQEEHLQAACLDVTEIEPLPKNDPLWTCRNVHITPHISGRFNAEVTFDHVLEIFHKNLLHYINHEPLEHVVDKSLGY